MNARPTDARSLGRSIRGRAVGASQSPKRSRSRGSTSAQNPRRNRS
jgi:hypothetical protein